MSENDVYRALQEHLDRQAVGYPATSTGEELQVLRILFTPEEARLALSLSYRPASIQEILEAAPPPMSSTEQIHSLLDGMAARGSIGWKPRGGTDCWFLLPLVVGMYEARGGGSDPEFERASNAYMATREWRTSLLAASPSQMRTIPVGIDVPVDHRAASYDQIRALVEASPGPFVVLPCICREGAASRGSPCGKTHRTETCLGFGEGASPVLKRLRGRRITREEAVSILKENEKDGLVLQPSNTQDMAFVCSCCGCCCGMMGMLKRLPHPLRFWTANFHAVVDASLCTGCGTCSERCQMDAVAVSQSTAAAVVDLERCIGCGLCTSTCSAEAIRLEKNAVHTVPPRDNEELYDRIRAGRKPWRDAQRDVMRRLGGGR